MPFPNNIYIPSLVLHPKAKFTDLISSASIKYPVISPKLYDCIRRFNHSLIKFHKISVTVQAFKKEAFMISGTTKGFELLDLYRTEIDLLERFKFFKRLDIVSSKELEDTVKNIRYPNTIAITNYEFKCIENIDIFYIANIPGGGAYFLSDRLKQTIIDEECTGIEFEPIDLVKP